MESKNEIIQTSNGETYEVIPVEGESEPSVEPSAKSIKKPRKKRAPCSWSTNHYYVTVKWEGRWVGIGMFKTYQHIADTLGLTYYIVRNICNHRDCQQKWADKIKITKITTRKPRNDGDRYNKMDQ